MVTALVVTYGDRWNLLKQVLERLVMLKHVNEIILVDNGSQHVNQSIEFLRGVSTPIHHLVSNENLGSAGAFKKGLMHFVAQSRNRFVWLLDDDNLPESNALELLLNKALAEKQKMFAFAALRTDRPYLVKAAKGFPLQDLFPTADSYLGVNIFKSSTKPFGVHQDCDHTECTSIPMAPYGGLLLSKETIEQIGFPLEDFYLYGDDFEYTYRITARGGCICLVKESIVNDVDTSWVSTKKRWFKPRLLFQDDFRSRYAIRNAVFFSNRILKRRALVFRLNEIIVNAYFLASAFLHLKPDLFFKYLKLANEGKRFTPQK